MRSWSVFGPCVEIKRHRTSHSAANPALVSGTSSGPPGSRHHQPYTCRLPPAAVRVARDELREIADEREGKIQELRHWIESHPDIKCRTDTEFILRFLRVAKFQVHLAKDRLARFCVVRSSPHEGVADWFCNDRLDPTARQVLATGFFIPLPKRDQKGRRVILIKADRLNFGVHGPEAVLRGGLLAADQVISESEEDNIHGYVLLHDMSNIRMEHMLPWTKSTIKRCLKCWQDVYPFRMKEYNVLTSSVIIKTLLNFLKKLIKEKYKKRIFIYSDHHSLYSTVPREILPREYGGDEAPIPVLIDQLGHSLDVNEHEFQLLRECRLKTPSEKARGHSSGEDNELTGDALMNVHGEPTRRCESAADIAQQMNELNLAHF